ncbi:amino acid ABC transporter substrate-binding protein [Aquabacterium sp.]|uniref:amino acid ABC transporter substrate-binding protein n=1 Tax=Aquabacterium sp. TaxID=1872578 RepID=UPI002BA97046|nr:amino acid ABC transporter substrate-binding protein [Aquabacterium sp.]HSW04488.1 amino acid ABC transporter substrate-binding protein [Aquabacterium sp.]
MTESVLHKHRRGFVLGAGGLMLAAGWPAFAQPAAGAPLRVGGTLPLTGPLASVGMIHKIAGDVFVDAINKRGGLLGRKLEWVLLDDQSQPANARTLYERLITAEKVDLLMGPYGTSAIIAAMGVAQRFNKLFIQSSLGDPSLAPYEMQFPALPLGPDPRMADTEIVLAAYASLPSPPKTIAFITSKFPSALDLAKGGQEVAGKQGLKTVLSLEYEFGTREFGGIAARIKDANPDLLWSGAIGMEAVQLLDAMKRLDYLPKRHFYLFPAPGPTAAHPNANGLTSLTWFEDHEPFRHNTGAAEFIEAYTQRATAAGLSYTRADYQAAAEFAAWQMLEAAAIGAGRIDDKAMGAWLKANLVKTVLGSRSFEGKFNSGLADTKLKQVQDGKWVTVWPTKFRPRSGAFIAP